MKKNFKLGFTTCLTIAVLLSSCKKDDEFVPANGNKTLLSELCVYTDCGYSGQTKTEYQYDARGNCVEKTTIDNKNGELESIKYEYGYDDCNRLTKYEYTGFEGENISYHSKETHKFDKYGNQTEYAYNYINYLVENYKQDFEQTWEYEYDEQGNILKYTSYQNGRIQDEREYTYNGNVVIYKGIKYYHDVTETYPYSAKEEYSAQEEYEYVNNRKLLKTYSYKIADSETEKKLYKYDNEGNTISYEYYTNGELFEKWYYEGNTYYYARYYNNSLVDSRKIVYTNSKRNQILTEERDNSSERGGGKYMSKYKYDSRGNQIGYEYYVGSKLMNEYTDYVYDSNKVTYTEYSSWCNDTGILYHTLIYTD